MSLPKEGADALRQCVRILAPLLSSNERATMARCAEEAIQSATWMPAFRLKHIAALFHPSDPARARELLELMEAARERGDFPSGACERGALPSDLAAWPDCPPVPSDSPLRYWLPVSMTEAQAEPDCERRIDEDDWQTPIRFGDLAHRIAKLRFPKDLMRYGGARLELERELDDAVTHGVLVIHNPLSGRSVRHAYPDAEVRIDNLRPFLASCGMSVPVAPVEQAIAELVDAEQPETASDSPEPLDTPTMAGALDRIGGKQATEWKKMLGDPPKWMHEARVSTGARGKLPATWNPVLLVGLLKKKKRTTEHEARRLFQSRAELAPWADAWHERGSRAAWFDLDR